ncbi:MAG: toll/interleukin-1 receptor domain-containing protein [Pseudomonadota bacterium]|nr:toll/interleukin-1 receptor domain-containing protein [Gammaproteobacteria bacterium]MDQ3581526.1 toll/interleukin-1 receptor domain-containing protein [Pseudomonadota bacterium]
MVSKRIFLASSSELKEDRKEFEIFINRKNKDWVAQGVFLELIVWEDFLDAVAKTRLQDEYNKAIRECDIFVMLFCTKVGQYTEEEFETAFGQFKATNKPFIFTYFKDAEISTGSADRKDLMSLWAFQEKLDGLGHFYTVYKNIEGLKFHFNQQLDKLAKNGFIELKWDKDEAAAPNGTTYQATLTGNGAIAQGTGATAIGAGGVNIGGKNTGNVNTGTQANIDTGGGAYVGGSVDAGGDFIGRDKITHGLSPRDLAPLFGPLLAVVAQEAPADKQAAAVQQVEELKAEVAKGKQADDGKVGRIVDGLVAMVPGAIGAVVNLFATPILGGIAGPVTKYVLDKLKGN